MTAFESGLLFGWLGFMFGMWCVLSSTEDESKRDE